MKIDIKDSALYNSCLMKICCINYEKIEAAYSDFQRIVCNYIFPSDVRHNT